MLNGDSEAVQTARAELDAAVRNFVLVRAAELGYEDAYVLGWAGFAEYTTMDLQTEEATGNIVLVPDDQPASMSRGLYAFGSDAFTRSA